MIRVCHIITGLYTGGAEMMLYKLLGGMDRERFESSVISLIDKGALGEQIEALGVPVHTLDMKAGQPSMMGLVRLCRLVRRLKPAVVQGWMYHGNLAATLAARWTPGAPVVLWNVRQTLYALGREKPLTRGVIRLSARLSGSPRFIVYNARASAEQHEGLGFRRDRRVILPNGFEGERFAPSAEGRSRWRRERGFSEEDILIGLPARYHPMKDHDNFLRAAAILAGRHRNLRLVLAGKGLDAENEGVASRIREWNLSGRVHLLGEQRDLTPFYQALDIAVLASAWGEGFPNVLGEAMASGVPCVATDLGESAEIVGDTGRIVPPRDSEALAAALGELIELGPERRAGLGAGARDRILARYTLPAIVARYEALYSEAIANQHRPL